MIVTAICSGCKVAISAAAADSGIDALALWSPESMGALRAAATGRRKTWHALTTYALKLTRRETWVKLATGRIRADMVKITLARLETRSAAEAADQAFDSARRSVARFRGAGGRMAAPAMSVPATSGGASTSASLRRSQVE